jgi:hypothetical protein
LLAGALRLMIGRRLEVSRLLRHANSPANPDFERSIDKRLAPHSSSIARREAALDVTGLFDLIENGEREVLVGDVAPASVIDEELV